MKNIKEETSVSDIPTEPVGPSGKMPDGCPYFNCDKNENMFWNLHIHARGKGKWFDKHYSDKPVAAWARQNKGKNFYLQFKDMFRKIKAK